MPLQFHRPYLAFFLCFSTWMSFSTANAADPIAVPPPANQIPSGLLKLSRSKYFSPYAMVVDKTQRTLTVWKEDESGISNVGVYATDLGKREGEKQLRGDHRTPEGVYFLQEMKQQPELSFTEYGRRAYTTNYPNFFDRLEGKTGDGIWLHAVPDTTSLNRGSRGCVVVRNDVVVKLGQYFIPTKTPFLIFNKVDYVPVTEKEKLLTPVQKWLQDWVSAWKSKNVDNYIAYYGDEFKSQGMSREKWKNYKSSLNQTYKNIQVKIEEPTILLHKSQYVVRFLQNYQSDKHADFGEKTLYVRHDGSGYKIVGEEWKPLDQKQMAMVPTEETKSASAQSN